MRLTISLRRAPRLLRSAAVVGMLWLLFLTGCHTSAGFGKDLQSVGRNIQNSANKHHK